MDRRKAMAVAGASTAVFASLAVAYAATMSVGWLGFGDHAATKHIINTAQVAPTSTSTQDATTTTGAVEPQVVVKTQDVFDRQVVEVPTTDAPVAPAPDSTASIDDEEPTSTTSTTTSTTPTTSTTVTRTASSASNSWSESEDSHESESEHSGGGDD